MRIRDRIAVAWHGGFRGARIVGKGARRVIADRPWALRPTMRRPARVAKQVDARDLKQLSTRVGNARVNGVKFGEPAARNGGCNPELSRAPQVPHPQARKV